MDILYRFAIVCKRQQHHSAMWRQRSLKLLRNEIVAYWVVIVLLYLMNFSTAKRTFYIYEGTAPGELVGNLNTSILAVDPQSTKFQFNSKTGVIKSTAVLDRELKSLYHFKVAKDPFGSIQVDIEVKDVNDEYPTFSSVNKTANISEAYDVGHIYNIELQVTDKDVGVNGLNNNSVKIVSGNMDNVFKINLKKRHSFFAIFLEITKKLNWTAEPRYKLILSASDGGTPRKISHMTLTVNVVDFNDCSPQFSRPRYVAEVSESVKQGTIVLNITTSDCDGGKNAEVLYKMNYGSYYDKDRYFHIRQENRIGYIVTTLPLNFEKTKSYKLQVIATNQQLQSTAEVTVYVRDENDNSPEIGSFHFYPITEDAKLNSLVASIKIFDKDSGDNGRLSVNLSPRNRHVFSISKFSQDIYHVYLNSSLDYEKTKTYLIIVTVTDHGKPPRASQNSGTLLIIDVNDNPPKFDHDVYTGDILESEVPGTSVLTVNATDKDDSVNITYNILSSNSSWFGINSTSGVIYVASFIDREKSDNVLLVIQAFDGVFTTNCTVALRIIDSNDNAPQFSKPNYQMTVHENSMPQTFVGKVVASDADLTSKGHISFTLDYPTNTVFAINKTTGYITTIKELDREDTGMYNFTVVAQDEGGLNSTTKVTVIVEDVNDNRPFFTCLFYNHTVYENVSTGTDLIKIDAKDYDVGWNAQISYEIISGNDDGTFNLDKSNGQISVHKKLDREKVDRYVLKFRAIDNGGLTSRKLATVQILVQDVNDDPPVFQKQKYSFSVKENTSASVFIGSVQANSYDEGSGGIISYSIKSLVSQQHFFINDSGAIFTKAKLDHEIHSKYEFLVEARDHGTPSLFGYVNVTVTVLDINDNFPLWQDYSHCIKINEDHSIDKEVYIFNAVDKDSGLNGKVTYNIVRGPKSVFSLDSETGYLTLNMPVDYELVKLYHLTVNASDSGKPALWSLLKVNICIVDVNDNVPILHNSSINVSEGLPINALIYNFRAVDKDSGQNGKVWYRLDAHSSHFELSGVGNLTLKSPLDRETQDEHELLVTAGDYGAPIKTSMPAKLTIYVQDVNDEIPVFTGKLSFFTTENKIAGTLIGMVEAKDRDLGKNAEIEYSLINSTNDFKIESKTGELQNIVELDREKYPIYRMLVQASDNGNPRKMSRVTVTVHVEDVNDNPPIFTTSTYYINVAENAEKGAKVIQVKAVDKDAGQNGKVNYYHNTGNTQSGVEVFQINETTGSIYIVASLDREIKEFFVLSVVAKDNGSPLKESVCQVLVTVLDVNDHKPEFRVKNDTIYLSEKTLVGSIVYWANATDQDKDENGNIIYSIVKESGEQIFGVNAKTGAVILNKTLDYEHTKQYSLRIRASDNAKDNPKKSILRLYINILDSNDNGPIFDENPIFTYVIEGSPRGTEFHKPILAHDKDSGINSRIVYSIESQSPKAAFKIDPFKAQLSTDAEIDREDVSEYKLVVKAVDQAGEVSEQKSNTVTVIILISDVNDCHPVFTSQNKSFIMEDEPVNFTVFYFTAEDKDSDRSGNVTFSLVEGNERGIFYLDPYWGSLILLKPLDREKVDTYRLKIRASDQGSPPLSSAIIFTLSVEDVNDNLPRFLNYIYRVNVSENINFAHVLKVKAKDLDSGQLTYSLPPGFANDLFIINESTGQILTKSPLDREKQQMYELTVYVRDNGYPLYTDSTTVEINVTDKNDNYPIVLSDVYEVKVLENSPAGYIGYIIAQDFDAQMNARLQYSIEEGNNAMYFQIDKKSGALSTLSPLDREISSVHDLVIDVSDQGHPILSTKVKLSVIVIDENDNNPKFSSNEIKIRLPGNSQPGTKVVTLAANDSDSDSRITYSFGSEQQLPFALDSTNGLIYTLNYLNASEVHMYSFSVNASDGSQAGARFGSIKVNVFVDRITGIPLRFTKVLYEIDLKDKIKAGIKILQLQFKNRHLKPGDVEYIREGGQTVLAVGFTGGNVSFTEDPQPGAYLFSVRATLIHDRSMTAMCFVLVMVQDTIQRPSFSHSSYSATLNENDPPGTPILTVKSKTSGNLSYQIVNGNTFDAFEIDSNGQVTVKKDNALDYERSRSFELDIKGDWGNTVTNIAFTKVYLTLRNLDDKAPEFRQKVFISSISESSTTTDNRLVTKLYAFNFGNSKMSFNIVSGNKERVFSLNSLTGELFLQKAVDREVKKLYNLTVSVSTSRLFSSCTVVVLITDINDNVPHVPGTINLTMLENMPLGSQVGQVNASDKDDYSVLTYSFAGNTQRNGPFVIDIDTGILRLVEAVDFESKPNVYSMDVFVSDQVQKANTKVIVTVLDENDHKPVFEKSSYSKIKRKEPISANTNLARINATDKDEGSNKRITYNVTLNDEIGIDPNTGIVFTKKEIIYSKDFIDLIITATDHGSPKLSSQVPFRLQILHVNNNPPDLGNATYDVTISEDIEVGTIVETIKPLNSESLTGKNRISFQILSGDELKMFRIEERTGIIRVRRQLDRENTDLYNLDVIAKDGGKSDISDRITVRIKIDDVNDNAPVFQRNEYYVNDSVYEEYIGEDVVPPRLVLKVLAKDKDSGRNKEIRYSISSGNNDGWFSMKDNELWMDKPLDRDIIPIHRLSVRATDQGMPPKTSDISVVIKVNDINDNAPVFSNPWNLGVAENARNGTYAGTITASDSDSGANQNISLSIINGTGLKKFNIDPRTGNLTNAEVFDYEKKSSYTLVVKAQDHGTPPKYTTLSVIVPVIGVDEFQPTFQNSSYKFVVSGDGKKGDIIGRVYATDSDSGPDGEIQYKLNSPISLVAINITSGSIDLTEDVVDYYERKRNRRDTEGSNKPELFNVTVLASSGQPGSKVSTVTAEILLNYTVSPPVPRPTDQSMSEAIQTIIIAISIVASLALVAFLIWLFVRCKRKEKTETEKPGEEMVLRPIPLQTSFNSVDEKGLINRYEHVPTSASNSLESRNSGSGSSDEQSDRFKLCMKNQVGSNITDSGIQADSEVDTSPDSDSDARSFDVLSDKTDRIMPNLQSIESLHDFDDEGGREASGGIDVGNLLYAKCAEADAEEDYQDRPRVFHFEGRPDYTGSLSSILGSHEELRGHYNHLYAMHQGPQYQPLSEVFSEIGRLPSKGLGSPVNGVNDLSACTSMLSSVSSLHNQHLDPESTYSSLPMTPNFTPAITPLVTRSSSLSPLTSEVVTPMVSPSQSRPSSVYLPCSRPSSSFIQLAERHALDDFDEDVHV